MKNKKNIALALALAIIMIATCITGIIAGTRDNNHATHAHEEETLELIGIDEIHNNVLGERTDDVNKDDLVEIKDVNEEETLIPVACAHAETKEIVNVKATCTKAGSKTIICEYCNEVMDRITIPATGHTEGEWELIQEATCTQGKDTVLHCSTCNAVIGGEMSTPIGHKYEVVATIAADCSTFGRVDKVCTVCGEETSITTPKNKEVHSATAYKVTIEPTCNKEGEGITYCTCCDKVLETEVLETIAHTDGEWVVTQEATCKNGEEAELHCAVCNEVIMYSMSTPLHHDLETVSVTDGTCTKPGIVEQVCKRCGETVNTATPPRVDNHTSVEVHETKAATCEEPGEISHSCNDCGRTFLVEATPAIGHIWSDWNVIQEATCTQGYQAERECTVCHNAFEGQMSTPNGHNLETIEVVESDCITHGYALQKCKDCGEEVRITLPPAGYGHDEGREEYCDDPNSEYYGKTVIRCNLCGEVIAVTALAPPIWVDENGNTFTTDEDGNIIQLNEGEKVEELAPPIWADKDGTIYSVDDDGESIVVNDNN